MSDEKKPFSRPKGPRTPRDGKPADGRDNRAGKPRLGKVARPGGEKFGRRRDAEQERGGDRQQRDFSKPRREGSFKAGERPGKRERAQHAGDNRAERRREPQSSGQESNESGERIAKRLARAGVSSRREAEALIAAGRVRVNGAVLASPAVNVRRSDVIEVDGAEIPAIERTRLFLFHKPAGLVTTNRDPEGRRTVFDILPKDLPRLMTVGRLDINTEGLLLLTNDGGLARVLELPSTGWLRRYRVRVHGKVDQAALEGLKEGIAVDGVFYGAIEASLDREQGSNAWLTLGLREGKNREVRNVLGALGLEVSRLIRVSYGPFQLGELPEGAVLELKGRTLRDQLGQRLVEESGADFSAPIATPFSNRPVRGEREEAPRPAARQADRDRSRPERARREEIGEGGLIKSRKRRREDRREDALGRLQTSRPQRAKASGQERRSEGEQKREEPRRSRSSNVWMAPGARPAGKGASAEPQREPEERKKGTWRREKPSDGPHRESLSPRRGEGGGAKRRPRERVEAGASSSPRPRQDRDATGKDRKEPAARYGSRGPSSRAGPSPRKQGEGGRPRPPHKSGPRKPRGDR